MRMSLPLVNEVIILVGRTFEMESSEAFFVGKSHWRVVNFRFVWRVATWISAISPSTGYCDLKELVSVERGPRAGFEPIQLCGGKLKLRLSQSAQQTLLPSTMPSVRLSTTTLNNTHLLTSWKFAFVLFPVISTAMVSVVTTTNKAAIGVFWRSQPQRQQDLHPTTACF